MALHNPQEDALMALLAPKRPKKLYDDEYSMGVNDPVELARLRHERQRELENRVAMGTDTRADPLLKMLTREQDEDPYTGVAEQKRIAGIQQELSEAASYQRPEIAEHRRGQEAFELEKASAGPRAQQEREHAFRAGQSERSQQGMRERQQTALGAPLVSTLNPQTGLAEWAPRAEAAGQRTAGSATEREAIQTGQNTLSNIDQLINLGDEIGWKGIGPTGGVKNTLYKLLGVGDPREDDFRVNLQKIRADIMFGSGGKQLTTSEQRVAAGYLADIYTNPAAAKSRLQQVEEILSRAQARRTGQPQVESADEWEDVR